MLKYENVPSIDWSDLESASEISEKFLRELGNNKKRLKDIILSVKNNPKLFPLCETHHFDDKIVIFDDKYGKGRIRIRLNNSPEFECIHNHRFSYSVYYLKGMLQEKWYSIDKPLSQCKESSDFNMVRRRFDRKGDFTCIHHSSLHSSLSDHGTVSLFWQGPPKKDGAFRFNVNKGSIHFKKGKKNETLQEQQECLMSTDLFDSWVERLYEWNVIE